MRHHDIEHHLKVVLGDFRDKVLDQKTIDEICNRLDEESQNEFAHIVWCREDIKSIRPEWSEDKVDMVMNTGDILEERSIEEGWEILNHIIGELD